MHRRIKQVSHITYINMSRICTITTMILCILKESFIHKSMMACPKQFCTNFRVRREQSMEIPVSETRVITLVLQSFLSFCFLVSFLAGDGKNNYTTEYEHSTGSTKHHIIT